MATKVLVNGKFQTRAGVYATIKSGVVNPAIPTSYGNVLIIDDGIGASFGGGSGISGENKNGADAIYEFDNLPAFQAFVKGGELWNLAKPLFNPSGDQQGVSKVFYVRAALTTMAEMAWTCVNGAFTIQTKDEGLNANGVLDSSDNLSVGYASKLVQVQAPAAAATFVTTVTQASDADDPQINTVVAANVNVGDTFSVTIGANTVSYVATTTLPADVYAALATAFNANSSLAAIATATVTVNGLVITADADDTPFTQTSAVVAAPAKFVFQIFSGTYKGLDSINNAPYDGVLSPDATPQLVVQSPVVTAISDLITWFTNSVDFNTGFKLKTGSTATGNFVVADIASNLTNGYKVASGATESYRGADFDEALTKINNLDFTHILAMKYGADADGSNNQKLFDFIKNTSKYDRLMVVAGGYDRDTRVSQSVVAAEYFNSDRVITVHGGVKKTSNSVNGFNVYSQLYHAAQILGRCAGLPPQVPVTLKSIDIDGVVDPLEDDDQEALIASGVMYSYFDTELGGLFVIGNGITSLQQNDFFINNNGTTYNWALKRIEADLNKSIIINAKQRFFDPNGLGGNRNTTSPEEVVVWATNYLKSRYANDQRDDLLIVARNVAASIQQDNIYLTYDFVGNTEISKLISTGTLLDA